MKIAEGFVLRTLGKDHIIVGEGLAQVNFNKMVSLNASAAFLWKEVEGKEFTTEQLADLLVSKYEVAREVALKDAAALVDKLLEAGILEA